MSASPPHPSPPPNPVLSHDRGLPKHSLWFCKNGTAITKLEFNSFEAFLLALAELPQLAADGASVDKVEIQLSRQRLKEQQCEELAAILACRIPLKKLAFDCSYCFERDTRMWKPSTAQALIGDAALRALLNSIGKNQDAQMQSLILKNCNIGYLGIQALEIALRKKQFVTLQILNLKSNPSIGSNFALLGQQLQFKTLPSLTELNLSDCNLNVQGGIVMSRVFSGMTGLKKLNLDHCKIELVSLACNSTELHGLRCLTGLEALEVAGNCLVLNDDASHLVASKKQLFFENLARLTLLNNLNLENCRLKTQGIQMFSKQCLCMLSNLTSLNVSVNGLVMMNDEEESDLEECLFDLASGIRHLKNLRSVKFNQGGFSRKVAQALCQAIFALNHPMYEYDDNCGQKKSIEGPIAVDVNYCGANPGLTELKNSDLPRLMWWDDGISDKWPYHYERKKEEQKSQNKLGSQLMKVIEAMRGIENIRHAHIHHHSTMAQWHGALAGSLEMCEDANRRSLHEDVARFHMEKADFCSKSESNDYFGEQADPELQLDIYVDMISNPNKYSMFDDVHWPLHCGIQEFFADEIIEHEVVGHGGYGVVKKVTILRNRYVLNEDLCMKTLPYPSQNETAKRNQLHTEIGCMGKFTRQELKGSSEVKNGHIPLRQGDWFQFEGQSHHTREFLNKFYCCRTVDRSKMPKPQEWHLDLNGNGTCGPVGGPQCKDCLEFQKRYTPVPYEDLGYKNLMPIYGVMFKPNPDSIEFESSVTTATDQTFSLIMKYLKFGSLMYRLDAGLAKYRESPPILRCSVNDWKSPERMFIGVDDWELKLHLALGIARGIRAMHADCVWHRDLKSSNVLINEYNAFDVQCPPHLSFIFNLDVAVHHQFLPLRDSSHNVTQDVLAIAAAREFGAYPFDMEPDSPSCSSSVPATTPRTPDSFISEICKGIGMSDQCIDHAEYLYSYFILRDNHHDDVRLDSTRDCIAATCVYLAEQASQTGPSCSIDNISSAFKCSVSDITRLKSKLYTLEPKGSVPIPVFYAYVCDFGLSKPSGRLDSTDNDVKGSLPYMAPEIFEQECLREFQYQKQKLKKEKQSNSLSSTPAASTPVCATPTRMTAITPLAPSTPLAASLKEQALKNKRRDIWAFGCVLYELATHRRPWYHKIEATSTFSEAHSSELPQTAADPKTFFKTTFWRNLGEFHGGPNCDELLNLIFPNDRYIPQCLKAAIRLCTQKDPAKRPHDIQIIIQELEKFSSVGSKRSRN